MTGGFALGYRGEDHCRNNSNRRSRWDHCKWKGAISNRGLNQARSCWACRCKCQEGAWGCSRDCNRDSDRWDCNR